MIEFWRSLLSDSSKKQYDMLLNGIRQRKRSVDLSKTPNILNEIQSIYASILHDHPELYYVAPQLAIAGSIFSLSANLSYLYDDKQKQEIDKSFYTFQQSLAKDQNKPDIDKVYAAAFLIMQNSRYEINNIYNQNAASAIHYHAAQCSGFASAFKVAMDYMGVWCIVVAGSVSSEAQSGPHAWNIVKLNESYYHIDVTSALASFAVTDASQLSRYCLFKSDNQVKQLGYIWNSSETPACTEMKAYPPIPPNSSVNHTQSARRENPTNVNSNLPTFTRLFDVQAKIRECLKSRTTYYEFALNIPTYPDEKLMRMITNYLSEQGKELSVAYEAEAGCMNGRFYLKINYKN